MAAFRHRAFAAGFITQLSDEFLHAFALAEAGFATSASGSAACCEGRAGAKVAMENDVNSFIALQPLNRIETRLFHDLFDNVCGRTSMIDCTGSTATSPVERRIRQIQSGGSLQRAAHPMADRRAA